MEPMGLTSERSLELILDGFYLSVYCVWLQKRVNEEVSENIQHLLEMFGSHWELVVGVHYVSERVIVASILRQQIVKLIFVGVLLWPHEAHMLQEVSDSIAAFLFMETPSWHR